jgi:hypothetical protein
MTSGIKYLESISPEHLNPYEKNLSIWILFYFEINYVTNLEQITRKFATCQLFESGLEIQHPQKI